MYCEAKSYNPIPTNYLNHSFAVSFQELQELKVTPLHFEFFEISAYFYIS